jgi:hypothetical protein
MYTAPPRPDVALPEPTYNAPLLPDDAVPVDNTAMPLTPAAPALAVCRSKEPDVVAAPKPVEMEICGCVCMGVGLCVY